MDADTDTDADRSDKFDFGAGTVVTQCVLCKHYSADQFGAGCPSFPGGIPTEILENRFDHRQAHPDESPMDGVTASRFEARPDAPALAVQSLLRALDAIG